MTVINYAFLDICWDAHHGNPAVERHAPCEGSDGALALDNPAVDLANLKRLAALKGRHPHLRLVASVGGWTRSNRLSDMAASPTARGNFIVSVVAFLRRHDFDGIDIDWEYPGAIGVPCAAGFTCDRPEDKRNFVSLARELRTALDTAGALDGRKYLSTIAAGNDRSFLFDGASAAWMRDLAASLDWINLMTYDYHGTWESAAELLAPLRRDPADPAPGNVQATVESYLSEGIAPRQLTLGMPFYSKGWSGCAPGPNGDGLYQKCAGPLADPPEASYEFAQLTDRGYLLPDGEGRFTVAGRGFSRHWSAAAGVPYLYHPTSGVFMSYEDERSIQEKSVYARAKNLRGAMYWELAADRHRTLGNVVARELGIAARRPERR